VSLSTNPHASIPKSVYRFREWGGFFIITFSGDLNLVILAVIRAYNIRTISRDFEKIAWKSEVT
jgi:hypothetical protein